MSDANSHQVGGSHYQKQTIQHWDYVLANDIPYLEAQVIKYVSRWRDKNGVQDLEKARHFLDKLIQVNTSAARDQEDPSKSHVGSTILAGMGDSVGYEPSTLPISILRQLNFEALVRPTGWVGFTFEGADGGGFLYRCETCRDLFRTDAKHMPIAVHSCLDEGEEPGHNYVDQDGA